MSFITILEVSKLLKCSTRSVYRRIDTVDTIDNLIVKGYAKAVKSSNGNKTRLFSKEWIVTTFDTIDTIDKERQPQAPKQSTSTDNKGFDTVDTIKFLQEQIKVKDEQLRDYSEQFSSFQAIELQAMERLKEQNLIIHQLQLVGEERAKKLEAFNQKQKPEPIVQDFTTFEDIEEVPEENLSEFNEWLKNPK